ncbi:MAG: hypothetical protein JWN72_861 [Thermoleophilia bacterium]|nr:hypothetical protein [Thermoleophilia bacterium]
MNVLGAIRSGLANDAIRAHAIRGGLAATVGVFAAETLLPHEGEKSELVHTTLVKEAAVLGAVAGLVISRKDPRAVAFSWAMLGGVAAGDGVHALLGSPRAVHYPTEVGAEGALEGAVEGAQTGARETTTE